MQRNWAAYILYGLFWHLENIERDPEARIGFDSISPEAVRRSRAFLAELLFEQRILSRLALLEREADWRPEEEKRAQAAIRAFGLGLREVAFEHMAALEGGEKWSAACTYAIPYSVLRTSQISDISDEDLGIEGFDKDIELLGKPFVERDFKPSA